MAGAISPTPYVIVRTPLYALVLGMAVVNTLALALTRADLLMQDMPVLLMFGVFLGASFYALRRTVILSAAPPRPLVTAMHLLEGLFFLHITWLNLRLLNHLTMLIPFPYVDEMLMNWDRAMGFDWLAIFTFSHDNPTLLALMDGCYSSLTGVSVVALLTLIILGHLDRARFFIETFFYTALACIIVGVAFPAKAAVMFLIPDIAAYPNFSEMPGILHVPHMERLRDTTAASVLLDPLVLPGLVAFPSFHTASGVLIIVSFWRTWLFLPALAYSLIMIAATPIFGGHYLVDLLSGVAFPLAVIAVLRWYEQRPVIGPKEFAAA